MGMGCCGSNKKKDEGKKNDTYKCEPCGSKSDKAKECCGKPMKKVK